MMEKIVQYTLQLRVDTTNSVSELEILAHPDATGQPFRGSFKHWEPMFESICAWVSSSAFHRKAIQRTLTAGLPAFLINRETGDKHMFSEEEVATLGLKPHEAEILAQATVLPALSTAA